MKRFVSPQFLLALSVALFVAGIVLPSYAIYPSLGSFWVDAAVGALTQMDLSMQSKSIYGTIHSLLTKPELANKCLGLVLGVFSIGFPASKYVCLSVTLWLRREPEFVRRFLSWGYFSMVEVYVVAVLAAALIPFIAIRPQIGLLPFFLSVLTAYFCHKSAEREFHTHEENEDESQKTV